MSTAPAPTTHIRLDDRGVAWIDQTNVKVIDVVLDKLAHGLSAEEIYLEHYKHLSLAQIHAAFSYYYDHQDEIDTEIDYQLQNVEELRNQAGVSPFVQRMKALGRLPISSNKM